MDYVEMSLLEAAKSGDAAEIDRLLQCSWFELNDRDSDGRTLLSHAAEKGHEAVVKRLLASDYIDPYVEDRDDETPLSRAARNGHQAIVNLLMDAIIVIYKDRASSLAHRIVVRELTDVLCHAAQYGHEAAVKILLADSRFDLNGTDRDDYTPLSRAAEYGHEAVVKLLVADDRIDMITKLPYSSWAWSWPHDTSDTRHPLSLAAKNGHEAVVKLLLADDRVDVTAKDSTGSTALMLAAKNGQETVVKLFLADARFDVNASDSGGRSLLWWTIENGHEALAILLLADKRHRILPWSIYGHQNPLSQAAEKGYDELVKSILATGKINVNVRDSAITPLQGASINGHSAVVKVLLCEEDIDVNITDFSERTLLTLAAMNGHIGVVKLLLTDGRIDVDAKDCYGRPWLWFLAKHRSETEIKLLLSDDGSMSPKVPTYLIIVWRIIRFLMFLARRLQTVLRASISLDRYSEFPNRLRPPCTTMPWNIRSALVVLWGVCWMFYSPLEAPQRDEFTENVLNQHFNIDSHAFTSDFSHWQNIPTTPLQLQDLIIENHYYLDQELLDFVSPQTLTDHPSSFGNFQSVEPLQRPSVVNMGHVSLQDSVSNIEESENNHGLSSATTDCQLSISIDSQPMHLNTGQTSTLSDAEGNLEQRSATNLQSTSILEDNPSPSQNHPVNIVCDCTRCNGAIVPRSTWRAHNDRKERPYTCNYPGCSDRRGFGSLGELKRHINSVHKRSRVFYCDVPGCPRSESSPGGQPFFRKDNLRQHITAQHKGHMSTTLDDLHASTPASGLNMPHLALRRSRSPINRVVETGRGMRKRSRRQQRTSSPENADSGKEGSHGYREENEELKRRILNLEFELDVLKKKAEYMGRELEDCKRMAHAGSAGRPAK